MVERNRRNAHAAFAEFNWLGVELVVVQFGADVVPRRGRKKRRLLLMAQVFFQFFVARVEIEAIAANVNRAKKRQPLQVIPVVMRKEDVGVALTLAEIARHQFIAERAKTGAGVHDEQITVGGAHFHAGRVAAGNRAQRRRQALNPASHGCGVLQVGRSLFLAQSGDDFEQTRFQFAGCVRRWQRTSHSPEAHLHEISSMPEFL